MTDQLNFSRFEALADAYGGVVARWPERHRADAARLAATPEGAQVLANASLLDARLDEWRVAAPSSELSARVASDAQGRTRVASSRLRLWWSGVGLAATLAGALAGTAAVAMEAPVEIGVSGTTSFGDVAGVDG